MYGLSFNSAKKSMDLVLKLLTTQKIIQNTGKIKICNLFLAFSMILLTISLIDRFCKNKIGIYTSQYLNLQNQIILTHTLKTLLKKIHVQNSKNLN